MAYACFKDFFSGDRWNRLVAQGARPQRPLWASTSTKNPAYPDTLYVDELVGAHTVNTLPYVTLQAALDHGKTGQTIDQELDQARTRLARLAELGIDLEAITRQLLDAGVAAFANSFELLIQSLQRKSEQMRLADRQVSVSLGAYQTRVDEGLAQLDQKQIVQRIWEGDFTVWKPDPDEISNRLGWLRIAEAMLNELPAIQAFVDSVRKAGYSQALLLGWVAPAWRRRVLRKTFGVQPGYLDLAVLDSTDPASVLDCAARFDPAKTLYIVSTKSGGTVETISFFKYFYNQVVTALGAVRRANTLSPSRIPAVRSSKSPANSILERHF